MLIGIEKVYRLGWGRQDVAPEAQVHRAQNLQGIIQIPVMHVRSVC